MSPARDVALKDDLFKRVYYLPAGRQEFNLFKRLTNVFRKGN
jgi:hypothetical protein